jgi:prenyl protein peptidase
MVPTSFLFLNKSAPKNQRGITRKMPFSAILVGVWHCVFLSSLFVSGLYLFKNATKLPRDEPIQIVRRTRAVMSVCAISLLYTFVFDRYMCNDRRNGTFLQRIGVQFDVLNQLLYIVVALFVNSLLFMAYIVYLLMEEKILSTNGTFDYHLIIKGAKAQIRPILQFMKQYPTVLLTGNCNLVSQEELKIFRNLVIGPVGEEIVFRSCMYTLCHFCTGLSPKYTIILSSLVFGLAHCHHFAEHIWHGKMSLVQAALNVLIQLIYTSLFAVYNGYIFIRTGSLWASIAMHTYCNYFGLPDFQGMLMHKHKFLFIVLLVSGLALFLISLIGMQFMFTSIYYE